jgi:hypothetical protein
VTGSTSCVDLDNGKTSLLTPIVDGLGADVFYLKYAMYLSYNNVVVTDDPLEVFVSNDAGLTWVLAQSYSSGTSWSLKTINMLDYVSASSEMRVKFVAQDNGTDNIVEAAIDSVSFSKVSCYPALFADVDGNGVVDNADASLVLLDFGPCSGNCPADLDKSGEVDVGDVSLVFININ